MNLEPNESFPRAFGVGIQVVHHLDAVDPVFQTVASCADGQTVPVLRLVGLADGFLVGKNAQLRAGIPVTERTPKVLFTRAGLGDVELIAGGSLEALVAIEVKGFGPEIDPRVAMSADHPQRVSDGNETKPATVATD